MPTSPSVLYVKLNTGALRLSSVGKRFVQYVHVLLYCWQLWILQ